MLRWPRSFFRARSLNKQFRERIQTSLKLNCRARSAPFRRLIAAFINDVVVAQIALHQGNCCKNVFGRVVGHSGSHRIRYLADLEQFICGLLSVSARQLPDERALASGQEFLREPLASCFHRRRPIPPSSSTDRAVRIAAMARLRWLQIAHASAAPPVVKLQSMAASV